MSTTDISRYLRWKQDVAAHDYAAASSYLSIRFGESRAEKAAAELRKLPVITRRANDIMRATGREPLPLSDPGVVNELKKVLGGERLSPILVAEADIADGYHRLSLAYALDPYAEVPLSSISGVALTRTNPGVPSARSIAKSSPSMASPVAASRGRGQSSGANGVPSRWNALKVS